MATIGDLVVRLRMSNDTFAKNIQDSKHSARQLGYPYYVVSGEVHLKEDDEAWRLHLLDEGFHYLDGDSKKRIMLEDDDGEKTVEPAETQLLDGVGGVLGKDDDPVYNDFDMIRVASWSTLPFFS
ncbi:hypothetical protein [Planctomicrobium sp. SH527]|uniref:hypothetical protein n=1 Tax=Planctomicrobium sp. SH527 TaxID=3448123 RepID=UPI003F5BFB3E